MCYDYYSLQKSTWLSPGGVDVRFSGLPFFNWLFLRGIPRPNCWRFTCRCRWISLGNFSGFSRHSSSGKHHLRQVPISSRIFPLLNQSSFPFLFFLTDCANVSVSSSWPFSKCAAKHTTYNYQNIIISSKWTRFTTKKSPQQTRRS